MVLVHIIMVIQSIFKHCPYKNISYVIGIDKTRRKIVTHLVQIQVIGQCDSATGAGPTFEPLLEQCLGLQHYEFQIVMRILARDLPRIVFVPADSEERVRS